jgi:hypothetical protein
LSGLADTKVEQRCHHYGHYDEYELHGSSPRKSTAAKAELVKGVLLVHPEIEVIGNDGQPKHRVQNAVDAASLHILPCPLSV